MEWLAIVSPVLVFAGLIISLLVSSRQKKGEQRQAASQQVDNAIAARFDDASELSKYIDQRVEAKVAPIREELEKVKTESHQMHDAVRARETQLWLWDQKGRPGQLPKLPNPILHRLGLGYLADDDWHTEPSTT